MASSVPPPPSEHRRKSHHKKASSSATPTSASASTSSSTRSKRPLCALCKLKHTSSKSAKDSTLPCCRLCASALTWAHDAVQRRVAGDADSEAHCAVVSRILSNRRDALAKHRLDSAKTAPSAVGDLDADRKRLERLVSQVAVLEHLVHNIADVLTVARPNRQRSNVVSVPHAPLHDDLDDDAAADAADSSTDSHSADAAPPPPPSASAPAAAVPPSPSPDALILKAYLDRNSATSSASDLQRAESAKTPSSPTARSSSSDLPRAESAKPLTRPPPPVTPRQEPAPAVGARLAVALPAAAAPPGEPQKLSPRGKSPERAKAGPTTPAAAAAPPASAASTASAPATPTPAGGTPAANTPGMFSKMREALARPSLGSLIRSKPKQKATPMFGVPLVEAATAGGGSLPLPLLHAADILVQRKLVDREGIFRLTGSIATIKQIKELYSNDGAREAYQLMTDDPNPHTIAGVLKLWLRELPERLIPTEILANVGSAARDVDRVTLIIDVIRQLTFHNRVALQKLCWVLHNVWQHREVNKMGVRNLSVVFAPFVLGLGRVSELMEALIRFYRFAFGIEPVPESDEALSAIMIAQFNDHTPPLSQAVAAAAVAAPVPDEAAEELEQAAADEALYEEGYYDQQRDSGTAIDVDALSDDDLRAQLAAAMAAQDFELCVVLRDALQSRG
jgi:hypothetical protein